MKFVFTTDMDGTLLNDKSQISSKTSKHVLEIKDTHHFILASGRSYLGMIDYYNSLKLTTPIITLNGAAIYYPDGSVSRHFFDRDVVEKIVVELRDIYEVLIFNGQDAIYSFNHNDELEKVFNGANHHNVIDFETLTTIPADIYNAVIVIKAKMVNEFEAFFNDLPIKARFWGNDGKYAFYDLHLENISKASALKEVILKEGLNENLVYTFGDGLNDLEMITLTKNGIAMKNGHHTLKKAASDVTAFTNNEDGVIKYILNLLKWLQNHFFLWNVIIIVFR